MLFTHGPIERQRFVPTIGLPPWKRVYGFRSDDRALGELRQIAADAQILSLELCLEAHYHGDTVLCSFGSRRKFVLADMDGLTRRSQDQLRHSLANNLVELQAPVPAK